MTQDTSDISGNNFDDTASIADSISAQVREAVAAVPMRSRSRPFLSEIFRGLGLVLPPLLTVLIFIWVGVSVKNYVVGPIFYGARWCLVSAMGDIVPESQVPAISTASRIKPREVELGGKKYVRMNDATYVPRTVVDEVQDYGGTMPTTGRGVYERYFESDYLNPVYFFPVVTLLFILLLYLGGKLVSARIGRFMWLQAERGLDRVPLVRNVYGAVKKVVDFIFAERTVSFSRVVAVEWPRRGIWSLALVTSEGIPAIARAAGEPVYSVLIPTSPMPMTGFTLHIKRSEVVELDITIDQALQFIVSCGVVIPVNSNHTTP